jgi:hypothetical protein
MAQPCLNPRSPDQARPADEHPAFAQRRARHRHRPDRQLPAASIKLLTAILGHSSALVADAIESFADTASSVVVWRELSIAEKPPDADHPCGHGRAETLATVTVAFLLLTAAATGVPTGPPPGVAFRCYTYNTKTNCKPGG